MEAGILLQGILFMAGLIGSFGPQNLFVLQSGLAGRQVAWVVLICIAGDILLALLGLLGMAEIISSVPLFVSALKTIALIMLTYYASSSLRRLLDPQRGVVAVKMEGSPIAGAFALTFLNPYVYLDTVFLLGTNAALHGETGKWAFAAGAMLSSSIWYSTLGFGSKWIGSHAGNGSFSWWLELAALAALSTAALTLFCQ